MKRSNSLINNQSIVPKHQDYWNFISTINSINSGSSSGNPSLNGGTKPSSNPIIYPKWSWLFDAGTSSPIYLSNNAGGQTAFSCTPPGKTARIEIYGITPSVDNGAIQGILSVTSVKIGDTWGTPNAFALYAYCSDAGAGTHNAKQWSITIFNSLVGGGMGNNTISFVAPSSGVKIDMQIIFAQPASWIVLYAPAGTNDFTTVPITQVTTNNMAGVADGSQWISIGSPIVNVTGTAGRIAGAGFVGTLESVILYLESGAGNSVATFGWNNAPVLTTKQGTHPPFCIYGYDASECVYGSGNAELFSPNLFTSYGIGVQHLYFGNNKNAGARSDVSAPARIRV